MEELLQASYPYVAPAFAPLLVMLLAPLLGARARTFLAVLMALSAVVLAGMALLAEQGKELTLAVPTVFGHGPEASFRVWTTETVVAPAWQWPLVAAAFYALAALFAFAGRKREAKTPQPVVYAVVTFVLVLATRIALEKTAAPIGVVWALGTSGASMLISLFFGFYAGRRGMSFGRWVGALLLANLLQRVLLTATAWFATTDNLGTHLDVTVVTELTAPVVGEVQMDTPMQSWLYAILLPQMTFALVAGTIVGIVLGLIPWAIGRRRARKG